MHGTDREQDVVAGLQLEAEPAVLDGGPAFEHVRALLVTVDVAVRACTGLEPAQAEVGVDGTHRSVHETAMRVAVDRPVASVVFEGEVPAPHVDHASSA